MWYNLIDAGCETETPPTRSPYILELFWATSLTAPNGDEKHSPGAGKNRNSATTTTTINYLGFDV